VLSDCDPMIKVERFAFAENILLSPVLRCLRSKLRDEVAWHDKMVERYSVRGGAAACLRPRDGAWTIGWIGDAKWREPLDICHVLWELGGS
jgi:hypothetical protein